jgi:hypothetical protein
MKLARCANAPSLFPAFVAFVLVAVGWHGYASVLNAGGGSRYFSGRGGILAAVAGSISMNLFSRAK